MECKKKHELWFTHRKKPMQFGLREFALVTRLKCHAELMDHIIKRIEKDEHLLKKYLGGKHINVSELVGKFRSDDEP